jgi:hypothetical protein
VSSGINRFNVDGFIDYHKWVMKNVPALKDEAYTTTLRNSVAKIEFQLNQVVSPNSFPKNYLDCWEQVARDLMLDDDFGVAINTAINWLDNEVNTIVKTAQTQKEKARKIFDYVRDNFTLTDNSSIYLTASLRDVVKNKSGSAADINLLLIAMLKNQKIDASPVILSTRDHWFTHEFYPLINRYNYVIAKVVADNRIFYLDATERQLAFGRLPSQVYNGQAREISNDMATQVYFIADSLKESGMTNVFISNIEKGGVEGSFSHAFGLYESLKFRNKKIKTLPDDFKKSIEQEYPEEIEINNIRELSDRAIMNSKLTSFAIHSYLLLYSIL